jgi:hypothetical protein
LRLEQQIKAKAELQRKAGVPQLDATCQVNSIKKGLLSVVTVIDFASFLHLDLSGDQVRRRLGPHLQLLLRSMLRQMRRKGHSQIGQGRINVQQTWKTSFLLSSLGAANR